MKKLCLVFFFLFQFISLFSQTDSIPRPSIDSMKGQKYFYKGQYYLYEKPKLLSFIRPLPRDLKNLVVMPFRKENLVYTGAVILSSAILIHYDQQLLDESQRFARRIHLDPSTDYLGLVKIKLGGKDVNVLRAPKNINTFFYQMGQGTPGVLIGTGLFIYGKITKDYRSQSTAGQLLEAFFVQGIACQVIKRITGRQTPDNATRPGGNWHFFPKFSDFQNNTPLYDAFPSGHLATAMATLTVLAENYPEKKYIKPVGYTLIGLISFAMMNNGVHWAGDYPLAIGIGYLAGKLAVWNHRKKCSVSGLVMN